MTMACPGCVAAPDVRDASPVASDITLHLPDIHCAVCIAAVEDGLGALPGVKDVRVNLTQKRAYVSVQRDVDADSLIDTLARLGHRAQVLDTGPLAGQSAVGRDLLMRIGVAGFAMMNVMLLSVAVWSGAADATREVFHLIAAAIALPAVAFSARPFFASAFRALSVRRLNMDVPIALAIGLSAVVSLAGALGLSDRASWFDAALALTFFLLVGRYLDHLGRHAAKSAAADLAALASPQAVLVRDGGDQVVRADALVPGDIIRVTPGSRIPADGIILEGRTELDCAALTGETMPDLRAVGELVAAGEMNLTAPLLVRCTRAGTDTTLHRLADLIAQAEMQKSRYAGLADRAARIYAPAVHLLGLGAFVGWWWATGEVGRALEVAISVLVITCPCALGLAVPAVSTVTTARLFRMGLLVKSRTALERLSEIDEVVFDKTGTLTTGIMALKNAPSDRDLAVAAGLAVGSSHPLSRAICAAAKQRGLTPATVQDLEETAGAGVSGSLDGQRLRLGRPEWVAPDQTAPEASEVWLQQGNNAPAVFRFAEELRPDALACIAALRADGIGVALLSGDAPGAVGRIAGALGLTEAHARMTPEGKAAWLQARADAGHRVLMVGDGLNDTGALAVAHASLAPATALDAARTLADVVLLSDSLMPIREALAQSRRARRRMGQNMGLALGYNVISVPLALAGLASPLIAAIAMSTSSLTVSANAMRSTK
ncbi:heavy metal translocating P-type ATPase [Puniceibacterium sediminis]|uniref:Cu2+-exporting ATPase n=1 Tax=Puniceibacterium sediminis TaxID=1608407 RepID=A0A238VDS4_9RHOB|nr:heavy metal translocating P-type ATPase [Puniceibacterium sediminis]SNR32562.1 Cu2+-exporting ATPase [Puniceibacterium sediminis]